MSAIRTFNVEASLPTLDEARRLVISEIKRQLSATRRTPLPHSTLKARDIIHEVW
jgi:hypothetical protein